MSAPSTTRVRRAIRPDAAACCDVVRRSISALCVDDHAGDAATISAWLANKTPENFERWIGSPEQVACVAQVDGAIAGFGLLNLRGTIALLYVGPEARFRGVSKALLAEIEREARRAGIRELVLESTRTAVRFYRAAGYVDSGEPRAGFGVTFRHPMAKALAGTEAWT